MGASFIRRYTFDPGSTVLLNIESVNILDLQPPASITGIGSGTAMLVGEFEDGPFNSPFNVGSTTGSTGLVTLAGALGYTYNGVQGQYPCAVQRKADGAVLPEYWNGNGFVQLNAKQFAALVLCRVNTSVGSVSFTRLASITGSIVSYSYQLSASQVLALDLGLGAGAVSATFSAAAATVTGSGATFASITAGQTAVLGYDGQPNVTVTFQSGDNSQAGAIARINAVFGFAFASTSGGQMSLTGLQQGNGGQVRVISGTALTNLGLTVANTSGTGNVANINQVAFNEVQSVIQTAVAGTKVEQDSSGRLRISNTATPGTGAITVASATTATGLGFTVGQQGTATGYAYLTGTAMTIPPTFAGGETVTLGIDNLPNFVTTFQAGDTTAALIASRINAAAVAAGYPATGFTFATALGSSPFYLNLQGFTQGGQIRVVGASAGSVLTKLGLTVGTQVGTAQRDGTLPAGTRVQVPGGTLYVTMQTISVTAIAIPGQTASGVGPYSVPVRFAVDDGTGSASSASAITSVVAPPDIAAFSVLNPLPTTNALTEAQIDAAYVQAFNSTLDQNGVASVVNIVWSARQSNQVRSAGGQNAIAASNAGLYGRVFVGRTPMGTAETTAFSTTASPGVGTYRSDRFIYVWPQVNTFVPLIAQRGPAGGAAFNASGNVDVGADGFLASLMSQLNPEENPGQETGFTGGAQAMETAFQPGGSQYTATLGGAGLQVDDYKQCKALGICAPRFDQGVLIFQSGVTSVDPVANSGLAPISRRRMADFLEDSVARFAVSYGKKLSTYRRRAGLCQAIRIFLRGLLSADDLSQQRIGGFKVDGSARAGNTPALLQAGLFRIKINVQLLPSMDSIVLEFNVGQNVFDVTESVPLQLAA